ncbi:MAG: MOSC domain-containing protein [Nocardioides sp.]|uniref:MOSC domain-containing protein n=1 Tax=Nocardioides sp. TaxID=35761 RepID=UPI0039E42E27
MPHLQVLRAGFAPVKGTAHRSFDEVRLSPGGVVGDRRYALIARHGGAARVLKTVQHPELVTVHAACRGTELEVRLPGGELLRATPTPTGERVTADFWGRPARMQILGPDFDEAFSDLVGAPVRLAATAPREVVYGGTVSIVGSASLAALADRVQEPVAAARFRANLVVATDVPFVEESWRGRLARIGSAVVRIDGSIPRCAVIDIDPRDGARGTHLLKELTVFRPCNARGEPAFGVFAEVIEPGSWRAGR